MPHRFLLWNKSKLHGNNIFVCDLVIENQVLTPAQSAMAIEEVAAARAFEYEGNVVVAAVIKNVYSSSERRKIKEKIRKEVAAACSQSEDKVIVTFDMEIFRRIEDADEVEKQILLSLAKSR